MLNPRIYITIDRSVCSVERGKALTTDSHDAKPTSIIDQFVTMTKQLAAPSTLDQVLEPSPPSNQQTGNATDVCAIYIFSVVYFKLPMKIQ